MEVTVDGISPGYTKGVYEGSDGWILFAGKDVDEIHTCCGDNVCLQLRYGNVKVIHRSGYGV